MYTVLNLLEIPQDKLTPGERGALMVCTIELRNVAYPIPWEDVANHVAWPADYPIPDPKLDGPALKALSKLVDRLYDKYVENAK